MQSEGVIKKRGKAVYVKQRRHVFDEVLSHLCCEFGIVHHVRTQRARPEENGRENGSQILGVLLPQRAAALLVVSPHTGARRGWEHEHTLPLAGNCPVEWVCNK